MTKAAALAVFTLAALGSTAGCSDNKETGSGGGAPISNSCIASSPQEVGECVEQARFGGDLTLITGERVAGSPQHQVTQDLCAERFAEHGFTVERQQYGSGTNVIGVLPGSSDERVIVSAHYDSVPGCSGADDNASGVAGVLETARAMGHRSYQRTLVVACWDQEELGLIGSRAYAQRAAMQGESIAGVFVYEMLGYKDDAPNSQSLPAGFDAFFPEAGAQVAANENRGDFIAIIGDVSMQQGIDALRLYAGAFGVTTAEVTLTADMKTHSAFGDLQRSDHAPFWEIDVPALHMTDTANFRNPYYHCAAGDDAIEHIDMTFASGVVSATVAAATEMLGLL